MGEGYAAPSSSRRKSRDRAREAVVAVAGDHVAGARHVGVAGVGHELEEVARAVLAEEVR